MDVFLQLTISGLATGMVYDLAAVGFVIVYKSSDVINFAQGELLLFGAYLAFFFIGQLGLPWTLGVAATLAGAVALGLLVERLVFRPLIGEPVISMIFFSRPKRATHWPVHRTTAGAGSHPPGIVASTKVWRHS